MTPTHAYIPGLTPRHPHGAFDVLRATVRDGMSEGELAASAAMQSGLRFLEDGFYWEAHEVLEPVWMACLPNSAERAMAQALIQIANARLKLAMGRAGAARKIAGIAAGHLAESGRRREIVLGVRVAVVSEWVDSLIIAI